MIDESTIYWITRLDHIKGVIGGIEAVTAVAALLGGGLGIVWRILLDIDDVDDPLVWRGIKLLLSIAFAAAVLCFLCSITNAFIPTTKEMCAIKVIPMVANSEDVQEIGGEIVNLSKEWLEDLRPKKDE